MPTLSQEVRCIPPKQENKPDKRNVGNARKSGSKPRERQKILFAKSRNKGPTQNG